MDTRTFDALTESMKSAYVAGLSEGAVPRPVIMPLVRGELVGLIWQRPAKSPEDALTAIASLSNIAAAASSDEIVLAWETNDVATACELPADGPSPCLNMVHATKDGHTLHQFPYTEDASSAEPNWQPTPAPQPGGTLPAPVQAAVDYSFTPLELDHPSPFGVTVVLMEEDGYTLRLTEAFTF